MWYSLGYANTFICTPAYGGRAGNTGDRAPVPVRLYGTPLPDAPCPCRGAADDHDCTLPALHRSDGAQRPACLSPARPRRAPAAIVTATHDVWHLQRWGLRAPAGAVAPESTDVRHAHQPMDARAGRRGQFRPGPDAAAGQRRSHACGPPPGGPGLLWALGAAGATPDRPDVAPVCHGAPRECGDHRVAGVVLRPTRRARLHRIVPDLGQHLLASQSRRAALDAPA